MPIINKDLSQKDLQEKIKLALQSEEEGALAQVLTDFADGVQQSVLKDAQAFQETQDISILEKRGIHQLTQKEEKFYQAWIEAAKSSNPKQSFADLDKALPFTVIDNVMEDLKANHPLLDKIDFQNMTAVKKMLYNKQGKQLAVWGAISSAISEELSGAIGEVDITVNKLSAFMPISKDMLEVGPQWLDAYVRAVLAEAVAYGLEKGIIKGTGHNEPIGMIRDIHDGVTVNTSTGYPAKTTVVVTELSDIVLGSLYASLATDPIDSTKARNINFNDVIFICNPFDYFRKVIPCLNARKRLDAAAGITTNTFDINNVIPSCEIDEGQAVFGLASKYKMGLGSESSKGGKIQYSDEYKFLDDQRYYLVKLTGNGRAASDKDFILLDISGLMPEKFHAITETETLKSLTVTSAAGTKVGDTKITITEPLADGRTYKYKAGATVTTPVLNQIATSGYTTWNGTADITAATGNTILIVEVDMANRVKASGTATVTAKA